MKRPPNTYLLLISYRSPDPHLAADVANGVAHSYVEHTYSIRFRSSASVATFMEKQLEELKAKMERSSAALVQFERELNVINPEEKTSILSSRLLQLNTEYTNAQTDRVRKESAWQSVQSGSLESAEVSTQGENLKTLSAKLDEANQKFADVKTHFGPSHPEYRKAAVQVEEIKHQLHEARQDVAQRVQVEYRESVSRETMLLKAVSETKAEFDRLNARSFEYQSLKREAEADKNLGYEELIRKIREAGINAGFEKQLYPYRRSGSRSGEAGLSENGAERIPGVPLLFAISGGRGCPERRTGQVHTRPRNQIATLFKTEVMGSLPRVNSWRRRLVARPSEAETAALVRADNISPDKSERTATGFEEAIRTLRNSILLGTYLTVSLAVAHDHQRHAGRRQDHHRRAPGHCAVSRAEV